MYLNPDSDEWALTKETLRRISPDMTWGRIMDAIHSCDPYTYGTMLWWLHERKKDGIKFLDLYMKISYVMQAGTVEKRLDRFRELQLPLPSYRQEDFETLFLDFLLDLKRTLQVLEPECNKIRFHTAI